MVVLHVFRDSERDAGGGWLKNGNFSVTLVLRSPLHCYGIAFVTYLVTKPGNMGAVPPVEKFCPPLLTH